ncbi:MAG: hypothetical protein GY755_20455 [Chloroflexi bacterium]|nr:hypothetical protein [Chloroflexota bacterium]
MSNSQQCEYIDSKGRRCKRTPRKGSLYCRRCELDMQKKFGLLEFPKEFFDSYKSPASTRILMYIMIYLFLQTTFSLFNQVKEDVIKLFTVPITTISLLGVISVIVVFLLSISMLANSMFWLRSEITTNYNIKRRMRTSAWKTFGFIAFPLTIVYWILGVSEGIFLGWENLPPSSAYRSVAIMGILVTGYVTAMTIKKPFLYFKKWLSLLFHGGLIFSGLVYIFEYMIEGSTNFFGPSLAIGPTIMIFRDLKWKKTILQQVVESIYTLPNFINSIVSIEQR